MRSISRLSTALRASAAIIAAVALTGCVGPLPQQPQQPNDPTTSSPTDPGDQTVPSGSTIEDFITGASQSDGAEGTLADGQADSGSGPTANVNDQATIINGGSLQVNVWSDDPFATVLVEVAPTGGSPVPGHYEVQLDGSGPQASITLTMAQSLPAGEFDITVTVVDESGQAGASDTMHVVVVEVGSGEVQVSVAWSDDSDVDLYVVDPNGETIYYASTTSSSGGELDLDSNAGCTIDGIRNENITWPEDAPSGTYEVRLNLWGDCQIDQTGWVVTVNVHGTVRTWEGVLEAPGLGGGEHSGEIVTTFEVP